MVLQLAGMSSKRDTRTREQRFNDLMAAFDTIL
jgi:hypothetical protein